MAFVVLKSVLKFGVAMIKKFAILIIVDACLEQSFKSFLLRGESLKSRYD